MREREHVIVMVERKSACYSNGGEREHVSINVCVYVCVSI